MCFQKVFNLSVVEELPKQIKPFHYLDSYVEEASSKQIHIQINKYNFGEKKIESQ